MSSHWRRTSPEDRGISLAPPAELGIHTRRKQLKLRREWLAVPYDEKIRLDRLFPARDDGHPCRDRLPYLPRSPARGRNAALKADLKRLPHHSHQPCWSAMHDAVRPLPGEQ